MYMRARKHPKPNEGKTTRKKIAALKTAGKALGALFVGGSIITSLTVKGQTADKSAQLPANPKHKIEIAALGSGKLPENTYVQPVHDGKDSVERALAARKVDVEPETEPAKAPKLNRDGYEIMDRMVPSDVVPDVGKNTLTMKIYTFRDIDGNIIRGNGVPIQIWLSKEQMNDLGVDGFDGKEMPIVLKKSNGGYSYFFIDKNWKGILQIDEPMFKDRECGAIPSSVMSPTGSIYKPLIFWSDSSSLLVATENGVFGLINGYDGELNLTDKLGIQSIKNPQLLKDENTEPKVLVFIVSNSKKCVEFILNKDGQMTGDMRIAELE